jgi:hypothetical protein
LEYLGPDIDLFVIIGYSRILKKPKLTETLMIICAWGIPLAPAIVLLVLRLYGSGQLWYDV